MAWLEQSYMGRKAVARGKAGKSHLLNKAIQGEYHYVYGPYAKPVMAIRPGDIASRKKGESMIEAIIAAGKTMKRWCVRSPTPMATPR